eukprot:m.71766 g.71766  ORF g.71766 m.71766 type:complete len:353 (-) comp12315_c0_seq1:242-1300(-)
MAKTKRSKSSQPRFAAATHSVTTTKKGCCGWWWYILALCSVMLAIAASVYSLTRVTYPVHTSGSILITGTSTGIGRHAALHLARQGYTVFASVRKERDVDSLQSEGIATLHPILMDVTDQAQINQAVAVVEAHGEPLIAVVNNAGVETYGPLEGTPSETERYVYQVNVFGTNDVTRAFLPLIRKSKGRVVMVGSVAGVIATAGASVYAGTKFALEGITDALRRELAQFEVSVSLIEPGFVATPLQQKTDGTIVQASDSIQSIYKDTFATILDDRRKWFEQADGPTVTTNAIAHAITSSTPSARYRVANTGGVPAFIATAIATYLPSRLNDMVLQHPHLATDILHKLFGWLGV